MTTDREQERQDAVQYATERLLPFGIPHTSDNIHTADIMARHTIDNFTKVMVTMDAHLLADILYGERDMAREWKARALTAEEKLADAEQKIEDNRYDWLEHDCGR